jgi:hypothetical protein
MQKLLAGKGPYAPQRSFIAFDLALQDCPSGKALVHQDQICVETNAESHQTSTA